LLDALPADTVLDVEMPLPSVTAEDRLELAYRSTHGLLEVMRRSPKPAGETRQ
jgi:hypothetical protein